MQAQEAIKYLQKLDPETDLVITWWVLEEDFKDKDPDSAYIAAERQLENCIGHVNEWVAMEAENA